MDHLNYNDSQNKDLAYAVGEAGLTLNGSVCKKNDFRGTVNLSVKISDRYDFHWHSPKGNEKGEAFLVLWGNNAALVSQYTFLIRNYNWKSLFTENRWFR